MRTLNRNTQPIYFATIANTEEIKDGYGNATGQYQIAYSTPIKAMWNVSYIDSDVEVEMFGIAATNMLRIVAPKDGFVLDEASILWYGKTPDSIYDATNPKHNYVIVGIRPSLNQVTIYAKRVDVS